MIIVEVFNIRVFNVTIEMCSLVSIGVGPLYIISSWFLKSWLMFSYILGTLVGSRLFVESFVAKAFHEDFVMISSLLMLTNPHVVFAMLSLYYA
jgi:hypothetical protein